MAFLVSSVSVRKRGGARGAVICSDRRKWMESEQRGSSEESRNWKLDMPVRNEMIDLDRKEPDQPFDAGLVGIQDGAGMFNFLILVVSGLAVACAGLGPAVAKKLLFSSVTLSSVSGFGAFWVSRSMSVGKLPIVNKAIRVSNSESTLGDYVREVVEKGWSDSDDRARRSRRSPGASEQYFPFLSESEVKEISSSRPKDLPTSRIVGDFSDWE
eukprot:CAMPEP_0184754672 /NCGR_PEP_ID=MMETSP0315-20130426/44745_1 /TAXON_ID=101924 /ORGANISM="Rhodosorus marinus, Strain UTEX LB 2760" /LENGTH=212 /DNA_ID=CAMNT_0027234099 /DNA_START=31 /DNA_END=669 /DNA_ORIENTATION=+